MGSCGEVSVGSAFPSGLTRSLHAGNHLPGGTVRDACCGWPLRGAEVCALPRQRPRCASFRPPSHLSVFAEQLTAYGSCPRVVIAAKRAGGWVAFAFRGPWGCVTKSLSAIIKANRAWGRGVGTRPVPSVSVLLDIHGSPCPLPWRAAGPGGCLLLLWGDPGLDVGRVPPKPV